MRKTNPVHIGTELVKMKSEGAMDEVKGIGAWKGSNSCKEMPVVGLGGFPR